MTDNQFGAIEAGGTKFVCAVGQSNGDIVSSVTIPTTTPDETLGRVLEFFKNQAPIRAVGISCFGPLNLDSRSPNYGVITGTTKPGWEQTNCLSIIKAQLSVPAIIQTDVEGAALGERARGAAQDCDNFVYLTVGTGIGGAQLIGQAVTRGLGHAEMGHQRIPHNRTLDDFAGCCPYHGDCWEGLASGLSIQERWGIPASELTAEHAGWQLEAEYLALGVSNIIDVLMPRRIIIGGSVMRHAGLHDMVAKRVSEISAGYRHIPELEEHYIMPPSLELPAITGGLIAAATALI